MEFFDNEFPKEREMHTGQRTTRELFKSAHGYLINADMNTAYNILVKSEPKALPKRSVNCIEGYDVMYPPEVSIENLP